MIVCPRCSKENQDHYKFCLGCGAELPRDAEQPRGFSATPPGGSPAAGPPPAVAPPGPPPPAQFGGAAGTPAPPRAPGPPPAFGGPPGVPPAAPPGPPMAPPGPPMAPPGPPMAAPPMAAPPMAAPPMAAPPGPPPPASPPSRPPAAPPMAGGFGGPAPAPPGPPPAVGGNGTPSVAPGNVTCPQCGTSNNKNFKFCGSCGFPLANAASAPTPAAPVAPISAGGAGRGTLVLIRPDGTEGESISIDGRTIVGRETMPQFATDSYLSPRHASFHFGGGPVKVRDENSLNGIYMRIEREVPVELEDGAIFRIGQEIVRFERLPEPKKTNGVELMGSPREGLVGRICLVTGRDTHGNSYAIPAEGLHLGRERGDILFPDDGYVSGLHARIHAEGGKVFLTDVGSSNGTFIRIRGEAPVPSGTMLLMGQQLFRLEY